MPDANSLENLYNRIYYYLFTYKKYPVVYFNWVQLNS
jgi:hypothetical protein